MDIFRLHAVRNLIGSDKEGSFTVKIAEQRVRISFKKIYCRLVIPSCGQQTETNLESLYSYTTVFIAICLQNHSQCLSTIGSTVYLIS
jgi:hypothetical protein